MKFKEFGKQGKPAVLLIHGLEVSWRIFESVVKLLETDFYLIVPQLDGHVIDDFEKGVFSTVDDQAEKIIGFVKERIGGKLLCAYGLSLGGAITARIAERNELEIESIIIDAGPILPINRILTWIGTYYQACNVYCTYHLNGLYRRLFRKSYYFSFIIKELYNVYPAGGVKTVINAYKSVYSYKLASLPNNINTEFWYGGKEAFVFNRCAKHIRSIDSSVEVSVFDGMQHGQLLIERPEVLVSHIRTLITADK
jgi:pimeloyl-ACP methyl ester carboxylesterase